MFAFSFVSDGKQKWGKSYLTDPYERSLIPGYGLKRDPIWPETSPF